MLDTNSPGPWSRFLLHHVAPCSVSLMQLWTSWEWFSSQIHFDKCGMDASLKQREELTEKMKSAHIPLQAGLASESLNSETNPCPCFSLCEVECVFQQLMDLFLATMPSLGCNLCRGVADQPWLPSKSRSQSKLTCSSEKRSMRIRKLGTDEMKRNTIHLYFSLGS